MDVKKMELDKKLTFSVEEASELSGIGLNTIIDD